MGRAKRRWFVLRPTSDRNMPSLSYYKDESESNLKVINCRAGTFATTCPLTPLWRVSYFLPGIIVSGHRLDRSACHAHGINFFKKEINVRVIFRATEAAGTSGQR